MPRNMTMRWTGSVQSFILAVAAHSRGDVIPHALLGGFSWILGIRDLLVGDDYVLPSNVILEFYQPDPYHHLISRLT